MEQPPDFLAVSLLAAVSVTVGLAGAGSADGLAAFQSGGSGALTSTLASILGLDEKQLGDYLQGRRNEICHEAATLRSEQEPSICD
jgi:hypothetical protein